MSELRFWVPLEALSMNSIYQVIFAQRRVQLKPEARLFKTRVKEFTPPWPGFKAGEKQSMLRLSIEFHTDWYFKNGKFRKLDVSNLVKLISDAISEKLGFDDSWIWVWGPFKKVQSKDKRGFQATVEVIG